MSIFKSFEKEVLHAYLDSILSNKELETLFKESEFIEYTSSDAGYYFDCKHPLIDKLNNKVYDQINDKKMNLLGNLENYVVGFVLFTNQDRLSIECHEWCGKPIPNNIRDKPIKITVEPSK